MDFDMFLQEPRTTLTEDEVECGDSRISDWYGPESPDMLKYLKGNPKDIVQLPSVVRGHEIHSCDIIVGGTRYQNVTGLILPMNTGRFTLFSFPDLRWIWIPKQARIYASVFKECSKLESVYFEGTAEQWDRIPIQYYADAYGFNKTGQMFVKRRSYFSRLIPLMHSTVYFECSREAFR